MKTLWWIALIFLLSMPSLAQDQHTQTEDFTPEASGNAFSRLCSVVEKENREGLETLHSMACLGYVSGFVYGVETEISFVQDVTKQDILTPFCRPNNLERGQMVRVVLKYIRENPEKAHLPTSALIMGALSKAYPCPVKWNK